MTVSIRSSREWMPGTAPRDPYPSRVGPTPSLCSRQDPVVHADGPVRCHLPAHSIRAFERNGYLDSQLFTFAEVTELLGEVRRMASSDELRAAEETVTEVDTSVVRSIFRVHRLSPVFDRLARDPRLLDPVRQILGSEVYLHQARVNLKPAFVGREFYWHSDFETWHQEDGMPAMRAVSVSVALTDNHTFNGPLMLIPGSHHTFVGCVGETPAEHYRQSLKSQQHGIPDQASLARLVSEGGIVTPTGPAGSVVFFDCNTMHGSGSNISPYARTNVFFVYNSVENTLVAPFCGQPPRPEHVAARRDVGLLRPSA